MLKFIALLVQRNNPVAMTAITLGTHAPFAGIFASQPIYNELLRDPAPYLA